MRFPITPDYLEHVPEYIVRLYRDLDEYTLRDICRRLRGAGEITGSAVNQIRALRNRGLDLSYIDRRIKETLHFSEQEYEDIWSRAITRNQEYFDDVIQKADLVPSSFTLAGKKREFEAIRRQTLEEFRNISRSMGFAFRTGGGIQFLPIAKAYQKILDDAEMKLLSGVADYNTAIKEAVKQLTGSGLQYVDYASGWRNRVDVAARRAVMTGISQIAAQYSQDTMALLGTDLVEVTAHAGARDRGSGYVNHKSWQGKVYSMSGKSKKYPSLREVTGYGLGGGLAGWNCRHSFFAFVEGVSERAYTDKQLSDIDPPPFDYQGRRYTAYEATQMQRKLETAMRQKKRELIGYEAAGLEEDYTASSVKLRRLQEEYAQFSEAAGLRRQPQRARVQGFGRREGARARADYQAVARRANSMYDIGSEAENVASYLRDLPIREQIWNGGISTAIEPGQFRKHVVGTLEYAQYVEKLRRKGQFGPSWLTISQEEAEAVVERFKGTGILFGKTVDGRWVGNETITTNPDLIGVAVNNLTGQQAPTTVFKIHYGPRGIHIVPDYPSKRGAKGKK